MQSSTTTEEPEAVDEEGAARILGISAKTLNSLRVRGGGPPYRKILRRVVYVTSELRAWRDARRVTSTADTPIAEKRAGKKAGTR